MSTRARQPGSEARAGILKRGTTPIVAPGAAPDKARVRRNSRLVAVMKILLPAVIVAGIAVLYLSRQGGSDLDQIFSAEDLATLGAGLRLEDPRFAGHTNRGEPFSIRAEWALPDGPVPKVIDLERPVGEVLLRDGRDVQVTAAAGRMRRKEKLLELRGEVVVDTSDGYHVETGHLDLDMEGKTATAPGPVSGYGPAGRIEAGSFRSVPADQAAGTSGEIWFENGVRLVLSPADSE